MNEATNVPVEPLGEALERLRLEGAIFLRAEYSERWALADQGGPLFAAMMHPGAERLILFHVVASGRCWVSTPDGERYWANGGEVIVLPYGDVFVMGGAEPIEPVSVMSVVPPPPWTEMPIVRHGEGGSRTDIVCGCLYSEDPLFDPALKVFPPAFVVRPPPGPARAWFDASIQYALEETSGGGGIRTTKLPEMLLIEVLRLHLASAPASERGWLAGLRDRMLAPAMKAIHMAPERKWTVDDLAKEAAVSRSVSGRALPDRPWTLADPVRQRVAHARGPRPPRYDGSHGRCDRETRRIRLRGSFQSRVQTSTRAVTEPVASRPFGARAKMSRAPEGRPDSLAERFRRIRIPRAVIEAAGRPR